MGSTTLRPTAVAGLTRVGVGGAVLGLAVGAWVLAADRMAGMDAGPGTELGSLGWFALTWLVMMAAMMLPVAAPMLVAFGRRAVAADATGAFAGGYLLAWLAAGLAFYAAIDAVRALDLGFLAWDSGGRYVAV
jgi:predicted metal-binding membrane protein